MREAKYSARLAIPADAKWCADVVAENLVKGRVDMREFKAAQTSQNPSVLTFVIDRTVDGVTTPVLMAPIYLVAMLAHLGFATDASHPDRKAAMDELLKSVSAFMHENGVNELGALCPEGHPVKAWGVANGYTADNRVYLSYKTKVAPAPEQAAPQTQEVN